ncbi:MAG: TolC family protein [Aureliella sp.]
MSRHRKKQPLGELSLRWLLTLAVLAQPGCHTPHWNAFQSLRVIPPTADKSSQSYWDNCKAQLKDAPADNAGTATTSQVSAPHNTDIAQVSGQRESGQAESAAVDVAVAESADSTSDVIRPAKNALQPHSAVQTALATQGQPTSPRPPATQPHIVATQQQLGSALSQPQTALQTAPQTAPQAAANALRSADAPTQDTTDSQLPPQSGSPIQMSPFQLPKALPGADTPPLKVPQGMANPSDTTETEQREREYRQLYPDMPPVLPLPGAAPDPALGVMSLDQLQELARVNQPALRASAAAVESARGAMIQAGLPPNPNFGYEADTVNTLHTNGYHGIYLQQTIITARKLGLAAEAAAVDHANAYLDLQRTWFDVITEVRRQYFNTLAARQRLQLAEAFLQLSERAYRTQIDLVKAGAAAAYEPLQLRVLTTQARAAVIQAQQESLAAWRTLAAAVGMPDLPPSALDGRIDCPVPQIDYATATARLLAIHTDLQIARNLIGKNRTLVTLADRQPIPDINVGVVVQRDYTFDPGTMTYNLVLGGPVPVFDRNQGNRVSKRAELVRATQTVPQTENELLAQLAPAYARYASNRQLASNFRTSALRDQVRVYRGIYQRYHADPTGIAFNDIIVAQQTMSTTLTQYVGILQAQWQGVVDVGELLQVNDIFQLGPSVDVAQIPEITVQDSAQPAEEVVPEVAPAR